MGDRREELERFHHRHLEHFVDVFALVEDRQRIGIEPLPFAMLAGDPLIFHEVHVDLDHPHPRAVGAGALLHVEAEPARPVPLRYALGELAEEVADVVEEFDEGRRVRAGSAPDRRLVDRDHLVDLIEPLDRFVLADGSWALCKWLDSAG